jgi:AbrB family looped-hinge helix DNA binding protein
MNGNMHGNEVQIGAQGRVVIPAALRKALNLAPGDRLIARQDGDSLVLERREAIERRLWDMFSHIPKEISLVDELIAERRAEARRENEE